MNRLQAAVLQEAFRMVAEGLASVEDVDVGIRKGHRSSLGVHRTVRDDQSQRARAALPTMPAATAMPCIALRKHRPNRCAGRATF